MKQTYDFRMKSDSILSIIVKVDNKIFEKESTTMTNLFQDSHFRLIIFANIAASIGSGITMIAIPWLLVTSENGEAVFGYVALCMTILSFILTPFVGT